MTRVEQSTNKEFESTVGHRAIRVTRLQESYNGELEANIPSNMIFEKEDVQKGVAPKIDRSWNRR